MPENCESMYKSATLPLPNASKILSSLPPHACIELTVNETLPPQEEGAYMELANCVFCLE